MQFPLLNIPTMYYAFSAPPNVDHKSPSTPTSSLRLVLPSAPSIHVAEGRATCRMRDEVRIWVIWRQEVSEYCLPPAGHCISWVKRHH